ncbi:MAG: hypothetical protein MUC87_19780 [Bacteroidia bacterium]|nr:hypothetical protein [Bacteroidia bacterium]
MKSQPGERHRLTTLQRQIMQWLFLAGGGSLPLDELFSTLAVHSNTPYTSPEVTAERLCEAVEQLLLMDYAEVRDDSRPKLRTRLSLYDFAPILQYMTEKEQGWKWRRGVCPVVALSDAGYRYAAAK